MKIIIYYLVLLIFIALLSGFIISRGADATIGMKQILPVSAALILYVVGISLVGEGKLEDERESAHRYLSNRAAFIAGTAILSLGTIYQLLTHNLDYWLLVGLIAINLTKIISLIFLNYRK